MTGGKAVAFQRFGGRCWLPGGSHKARLQQLCLGHSSREGKGCAGSVKPWHVVPLQKQEPLGGTHNPSSKQQKRALSFASGSSAQTRAAGHTVGPAETSKAQYQAPHRPWCEASSWGGAGEELPEPGTQTRPCSRQGSGAGAGGLAVLPEPGSSSVPWKAPARLL